MDGSALFRRIAAGANKAVLPLLHTGPGQRLLGRSFAVISYRGRRSGREITLPVNYRRDRTSGDVLVLVAVPAAKTWWHNFSGDGAPLRIRLGDTEHEAHGRAIRNAKGGVTVRITLA